MNEDEHHKEVYAHYGLAVYLAQVFESGLINALVTLDFMATNSSHLITKTDWSDSYDAFFNDNAKLPIGPLLGKLKKFEFFSGDLKVKLELAAEKRNFLVHRYFRDNINLFATEQGREQMIEEFKCCADTFTSADRCLSGIIEPINARYGLTQQKIDALLEELFAERKDENASGSPSS
ncbi:MULTISPECIES: hypothetical protein [Acetobacter]|uniref:hypothetical protein n=1 Tax=Acetobacter TaxID=434 RepID=UPI0037705F13